MAVWRGALKKEFALIISRRVHQSSDYYGEDEKMEVLLASVAHIEELSALFDQYRIFYKQTSDLDAARRFLQARLENNDSVIFVARDHGHLVGFTQLYPSFSSVSINKIWILNDLFVEEISRRKGGGKLLMDKAEKYARETGAARMVLSTQITNKPAQMLYEARGYIRDEEFRHYALPLR